MRSKLARNLQEAVIGIGFGALWIWVMMKFVFPLLGFR
jgi:hypothetical protein